MSQPVAVTGLIPTPDSVRAQLARILASPAFAANERSCRFLAYVVNETLSGRAAGIKQATIGCEAFGRPASYDPKQDAIVRSVARVVREKLNDYYLAGGAGDLLRIDIPKGTYVPSFRQSEPSRETRTEEEPVSMAARRIAAASAACCLMTVAGYAILARPKPVALAVKAAPAIQGDASVLLRSGRAKIRLGDFAAARPLLETAVALDPENALAHASLAEDLAALGCDGLALEEARKAGAASGHLPSAGELEVEAVFRSASGDHRAAAAAFADLVRKEPLNIQWTRGLAREQCAAAQWTGCLRTVALGRADDAQLAIAETYCRAGAGDYLRALQSARRAVACARAMGERETYARARLLEAGVLMSTSHVEESVPARDEARGICAEVGDDSCSIRALRIQGNLDIARRRPAPALAAFRAALPLARKIGSAKEVAELQDGEGWALMLMDDFSGARAAFVDSLLTAQRAGRRTVQSGQELATLALFQGQFDRAVVMAEQAEKDAHSTGDRVTEAAARILKARALLQRGDFNGSAAGLAEVRREIVHYGLSAGIPREWRLAHADLSRSLGRLNDAEKDLDANGDFDDRSRDPDYQVARLQLLLSQRRHDEAVRAARETLAFLEGSGNRSTSILVTALLSDAYGYSGRLAEARQMADAARAMLSERTSPLSRNAALASAARWAERTLEASAQAPGLP